MSSVVPNFEYDIFISYRHNDNLPTYDIGRHGRSGWVTEFVNCLKEELASTIKEPVSVYFDSNPHDGLLETYNVDKSLEGKLKCLIFIPILSQTYCDPKSFAWQNEFCVFNKLAREDDFGRDIKLFNGNVTSRILPIKIHELDVQDKTIIEKEIGGVLRVVEFIYREPGVNRPLRPNEEDPTKNQNKILYRNQVNKVANAIKEIIASLKNPGQVVQTPDDNQPSRHRSRIDLRNKKIWIGVVALLVIVGLTTTLLYSKLFPSPAAEDHTEKSVAVLPFLNLSNDPGQEYFSDGLTEEMINVLARVPTLKVIGRTSSFQFKGTKTDLREIGRKLNVTNILEGSFRQSQGNIRISVTLINAVDGTNIWSSSYERKSEDVLKIQDEIAGAVVSQLKIALLEGLSKSPSVNRDAFDLYLKGRGAWNLRQLKNSENFFKAAIEADSTFPAAYVGLAETYMLFPFFGAGAPLDAFPKAQLASEKAIELDNRLSVPFLVLALKNDYYDLNSDVATSYFLEALRKNPYYAPNHYLYVHHLINEGATVEEALREIDKAIELEPLFPIPYAIKGRVFLYHRMYKEALEPLQRSLDLDRNRPFPITCFFLGHCYSQLGQLDEAEKFYKMAASANDHRAKAALINLYMQMGKITLANSLFDELNNISKSGFISKITLANAAAFTKKTELAHELLKQAIDERDPWINNASLEIPVRQPNDLLSDPRNVVLLKPYVPALLSYYNIED